MDCRAGWWIGALAIVIAGCDGDGDAPRDAGEAVADAGEAVADGGGGGGADGGGGGGDAGDPTDGGALPDAGPSGPATREAFVLVGHLGRLMMTCDAGETWAFDVSQDETARCWDMGGTGPECDHHTWAGTGIAYGGGRFVATFGWGAEGAGSGAFVGDGASGVGWTKVVDGTSAGVAYGGGAFVTGSNAPAYSTDDGATFQQVSPALHYNTPRGVFYADVMGGRHVIYADGNNLRVTPDGGRTFFTPDAVNGPCGGDGAGGNGVMVSYSRGSAAGCRSTDGGLTWARVDFPGDVRSRAVWTGSEIWVWGDGALYASADGAAWDVRPTSPANVRFTHVARSSSGVLLAVNGEWGSYYTGSGAWRSTDGVSWVRPAASDGINGHPIRAMAAGQVPPSACP